MQPFHSNKSRLFGLWALMALVLIVSCKKLDLRKSLAVKTETIVLNGDNTVTANGLVVDLGENATLTDRGHCWALTPKPTPADNWIGAGTVSEPGPYQTTIPKLATGTWYIRAFVTEGTLFIYGEDVMVTVSGFPCGTTLYDDRDGKTYSTVQIGSQCWMASNLNYGTLINSNNPSDNQTDNSIIEKYCYSDQGSACLDDGGLYQWGEAMNYSTVPGAVGICPMGWHIPSDDEWKAMELSIGMPQNAADNIDWRGVDEGTIIKEGGSSGFEAGGTGYRKSDGGFYGNPAYAYYWSSTDQGTQAWVRGVFNPDEDGIYRNTINKSYGLCIRCVQN